jgi:hypothetical protein
MRFDMRLLSAHRCPGQLLPTSQLATEADLSETHHFGFV